MTRKCNTLFSVTIRKYLRLENFIKKTDLLSSQAAVQGPGTGSGLALVTAAWQMASGQEHIKVITQPDRKPEEGVGEMGTHNPSIGNAPNDLIASHWPPAPPLCTSTLRTKFPIHEPSGDTFKLYPNHSRRQKSCTVRCPTMGKKGASKHERWSFNSNLALLV